jgi:DNA invertase Pin-like site-specific DNA recombinase
MARKLTKCEQDEYNRLSAQLEQLSSQINDITNKPVMYGYSRVSSKGQAKDGNSLEIQEKELIAAGAELIYTDVYTGKTTDRPELDKMLSELKSGDTLIVTKLDRIARSVQEGSRLIKDLVEKGVAVRILNMGNGPIDNSPTGMLMLNIMLSFAEFERDMILQRTQEGKAASGNYGGRKPIYTKEQIAHAVDLLNGPYSYSDVVKMTGISKSTLIRIRKKADFD